MFICIIINKFCLRFLTEFRLFIIIESDGEGIKVLEVRQNDPSVEAPGFIEENVLAYAKYRLKDS